MTTESLQVAKSATSLDILPPDRVASIQTGNPSEVSHLTIPVRQSSSAGTTDLGTQLGEDVQREVILRKGDEGIVSGESNGTPSTEATLSSTKKPSSAFKGHIRSLSAGKAVGREVKQSAEKEKRKKDQSTSSEEGRKEKEEKSSKKQQDDKVPESKEIKQIMNELKKKVSSLESENKDLKLKAQKRETKLKNQETNMAAKQMKSRDIEKLKQTLEENEVLKKKLKDFEKRPTDNDEKDIEIQLSELLAENEDLKIKINHLQQLLGKQNHYAPRYLYGNNPPTPTRSSTEDVQEQQSSKMAAPGEEQLADHSTVVLRPRLHGPRQSFRQSIHEKENELRIRREQNSIRAKMQSGEGASPSGTSISKETENINDGSSSVRNSSNLADIMAAFPSDLKDKAGQFLDDNQSLKRESSVNEQRLSLTQFFNELGLNIDNFAEVQEKILALQESIIARDEILEEASAELRELRDRDLMMSKEVTELKAKIIDLQGSLTMKDSLLRTLHEEMDLKNAELAKLKDHNFQAHVSVGSSISSTMLTSASYSEQDEEGDAFLTSQTTLVPGLAVAKTGSGGTLSNTDVSRLRQIIGELSFKLSQLQHYSDTVQREKSAMEQKSHENERLLKSTIDRYLSSIRFLRQMNFQLADQRAKLEELPELMREIQDMRMNLCDTEKLEDAQQEISALKLSMKEKDTMINDLERQLASRDTTINLLEFNRELQGGKSANQREEPHHTLLSPPNLNLSTNEEYHQKGLRVHTNRPQSADGPRQQPYNRFRSNSACRAAFTIMLPKTDGDAEYVDLEKSEELEVSKIPLGPSIQTDFGAHHRGLLHHKREQEIHEDVSYVQQLKTIGRHRRVASHDSFLASREFFTPITPLRPDYSETNFLETVESGDGSTTAELTQPSVGVTMDTSESSDSPPHLISRPKSVDSLSNDMNERFLGVYRPHSPVSSHDSRQASGAQSAISFNRPATAKGSSLKRGERVDAKKWQTLPHPTPWRASAGLRGSNKLNNSKRKDLPFSSGNQNGKVKSGVQKQESISSVESGVMASPNDDTHNTQVERNQSFASHGGESSPNSIISEQHLSDVPFPFTATGKSFKTISPELSSDEENTYPQKPRHHISRSVEDLAGSSRTHTIRRSFKQKFQDQLPPFATYHKQTWSTDSETQRSEGIPIGPYLRFPSRPTQSELNPSVIENDSTWFDSEEEHERIDRLGKRSGRVRSASTGSLMIIYQSESSIEDLKSLQDQSISINDHF